MKKRRETPDRNRGTCVTEKVKKPTKIKVRQWMTDDKNFSHSAGGLSGQSDRGG